MKIVITFFAAIAIGQSQTLTPLYNFTEDQGSGVGTLLLANGTLYGTTNGSIAGMLFAYNIATATLTPLINFVETGMGGSAGVIMDASGNLYGATQTGVPNGGGELFQLTTSGHLNVLHAFGAGVGRGGLALSADGTLYGVTGFSRHQQNEIYSIGTDGLNWKILHRLGTESSYLFDLNLTTGNCTTVKLPHVSDSNLLATGGAVYGVTTGSTLGQPYPFGVLFSYVPPSMEAQILHRFNGKDGEGGLVGGMVVDAAGNIYGVMTDGGSTYGGPGEEGWGVVFELVAGTGEYKVVYNFTGGADGGMPYGGLAIDASGNLYGTTASGGAYGRGTLFELSWLAK